MTVEKIVTLIVEKGLSIVLSGLVIYLIWQIIKHGPGIIKEFFDISRKMTAATDNSTEVIKDTKDMHELMDRKIDNIQQTIEELKAMVSENTSVNSELFKKIEKLEKEVESLKKRGGGDALGKN